VYLRLSVCLSGRARSRAGVQDLVSQVLNNGLSGSDIGVICLYKAQVDLIREALQTNSIDPGSGRCVCLQE
jgi:superfamily I DNA and/or RNA helicase